MSSARPTRTRTGTRRERLQPRADGPWPPRHGRVDRRQRQHQRQDEREPECAWRREAGSRASWSPSTPDAVVAFEVLDPAVRRRFDLVLFGTDAGGAPSAWSAIYFLPRPGVHGPLAGDVQRALPDRLRAAARQPYVYLGYRVVGCQSLKYNGGFRPLEMLVGRPGLGEEPR
jgi:hypothetical protein